METTKIKEVKATRVPRYEAKLKVTGEAKYTSDHHFSGMTYVVRKSGKEKSRTSIPVKPKK